MKIYPENATSCSTNTTTTKCRLLPICLSANSALYKSNRRKRMRSCNGEWRRLRSCNGEWRRLRSRRWSGGMRRRGQRKNERQQRWRRCGKQRQGKNGKPWGPSKKMDQRCQRGLLRVSHVTCAERRRSCAIGQTSTFFFLCLQFS